jgi:hypothetical protein
MKKILSTLLVCSAALLTGCFELEDTLTVNANGSGSWSFRMKLGAQMAAMQDSNDGMSFDGQILTIEDQFRKTVSTIRGARLTAYQLEKKEESTTVSGKVEFDSILEMYRSKKLKKQFEWEFKKVGDQLEASIPKGIMNGGNDETTTQLKFNSMKAMMLGLKIDRTLVMPNKITGGNGAKQSENRARWTFEITKKTTEADYKKISTEKPKAICSAAGVTFKLPLSPKSANIDLSDFKTDDKTIMATLNEVKITAVHAQIFRGHNYQPKNQTYFGNAPINLTTEISWPAKLRPTGWSRLTILDGSDNTGQALKLNSKPNEKLNDLRTKFKNEQASDLSIKLTEPARDAESFSVRGALVLHVPDKLTSVEVPGVNGLVGKTLDAPELKTLGLTLKRFSPSNLELVSENPTDHIVDLKLISADKTQEFKRYFLNRNQFRDEHRLRAGFQTAGKTPENPTLVIVIAGKIGMYTVPFDFKDLKMP